MYVYNTWLIIYGSVGDEAVLPCFNMDPNQTGSYNCLVKDVAFIEFYHLVVCPSSEPLTEFFTVGGEVALKCNSNLTERVVWFRNTGHGANVVLDKYGDNRTSLPEDLAGRIKGTHSTLALSNLTLKDIGEYWCFGVNPDDRFKCLSSTKTILLKRDPFGINSTFYRVYSSLMACALLGMVCVLITVNLKTRRRNQTSVKTRRTAAQTQRSSRVEEEREEC
uniref:Immunoglobulin subtype 2 domain-containing protein n=1 Tax=Esox lucius TaxID=8010 RepID=A0A6Q2Z5N9_ESOLU